MSVPRLRLGRERIVGAALESDPSTSTMRELAARLGVSHSALYYWVADRDQLFDLSTEVLVDRALPRTAPAAATWRDWLAELAFAVHDEFAAVPAYAAQLAEPRHRKCYAGGTRPIRHG